MMSIVIYYDITELLNTYLVLKNHQHIVLGSFMPIDCGTTIIRIRFADEHFVEFAHGIVTVLLALHLV